MNLVTKSIEIGGKTITFETGRLAKQASGAVIVSSGDTKVLVTTVCTEGFRTFDFLPLTVDYQDRNGANGTIPGGFLKREGRSSERETLISRLIDRPLRPLFPKHFRMELQCIATVLSFDADNEADVLALCGAAASFHVSNAPIQEAAAGVRVCRVDGELVLNPSKEQRDTADIDLVVAGTANAITMVEGGASEASEEAMLDALDCAHDAIKKIVVALNEFQADVGTAKIEVEAPVELDATVLEFMTTNGTAPLREALAVSEKHARMTALKGARNALIATLTEGLEGDDAAAKKADAKGAWEKLVKNVMRSDVIATGKRIDGRSTDEIRDIWTEFGVAARAHGSAVFTRGETQGYVNCALGTDMDAQRIEGPEGKSERRFMLTYNFPPFCTGEARPLRGPKRREVGHGALARRALLPILPSKDEFPYVIRITSEILESNGSSSMATVCGGCLAMMDAGVPIKSPVAGIAMGLIKEGDDFAVLSDILGDEDHLGDMDFKVTGTTEGITAFQMDVKISTVTREIMKKALSQARDGRLHILAEMTKDLSVPRDDLSPWAPRITTIRIKEARIRDLIGPGGKVIRGIQEACGVRVTVDDSGKVDIASSNSEATDRALAMVREVTQEAEVGALYMGVVKRIVDFGAFVEIFPGTDGLVHISELAPERVERVTDIMSEGDEVLVRCIDVDRSGKVRLSRKQAIGA